MFVDDETKLARIIADLERIRKLLHDSDVKAEESKLAGPLEKPTDETGFDQRRVLVPATELAMITSAASQKPRT